MKVKYPTPNALVRGYTSSHKGYDFFGKGDPYTYCSLSGVVVGCIGSWKKNWLQGGETDPTPKGLTTEDYGNYSKIKHDDGTYELHGHLEPFDESQMLGKRFETGQRIWLIGNTGNSTGKHLHFELMNKNSERIQAQFTPFSIIEESPQKELMKALEHFGVKTEAELITMVDKELQFLKDARRENEELKIKLESSITKDHRDRQLADLKKEHDQALAELDGKILAKATEIVNLQTEISTLKEQLLSKEGWGKEIITRFTSRKFLAGLVGVLIPILNNRFGWGLDTAEVMTMIAPILAYIGAEGWNDITKTRLENK